MAAKKPLFTSLQNYYLLRGIASRWNPAKIDARTPLYLPRCHLSGLIGKNMRTCKTLRGMREWAPSFCACWWSSIWRTFWLWRRPRADCGCRPTGGPACWTWSRGRSPVACAKFQTHSARHKSSPSPPHQSEQMAEVWSITQFASTLLFHNCWHLFGKRHTTLQSIMMKAKLSQQGFWRGHENGIFKKIPTIPDKNMWVSSWLLKCTHTDQLWSFTVELYSEESLFPNSVLCNCYCFSGWNEQNTLLWQAWIF